MSAQTGGALGLGGLGHMGVKLARALGARITAEPFSTYPVCDGDIDHVIGVIGLLVILWLMVVKPF